MGGFGGCSVFVGSGRRMRRGGAFWPVCGRTAVGAIDCGRVTVGRTIVVVGREGWSTAPGLGCVAGGMGLVDGGCSGGRWMDGGRRGGIRVTGGPGGGT